MVFYSLVSLCCHFGPICLEYIAACSLLKLSPVKSSITNSIFFAASHLFVMCLIFICPCRTSCSHFSSIFSHSLFSPVISLDVPPECGASCTPPPSSPGTTPAARLCSSRPLLLHFLFQSSHRSPLPAPLSVVWFSSMDRNTWLKCIWSSVSVTVNSDQYE